MNQAHICLDRLFLWDVSCYLSVIYWEVKCMSVNWDRDIDAALAKAKTEKKPLLLDFSAAPA